ncbi:MAG TPA: hypothetical protein VJN18_26215 [Polyangiaceae bacterium]|nr:hypothetical protein [Polyangiaceae bacterium]
MGHVGCAEAPADCVRSCEARLGGDTCHDARRTLVQCYADSKPGTFSCVDDQVHVGSVCLDERRVLDECLMPGSGPCFDECVRQSEACDVWLDECEDTCRHPPLGCEATSQQYSSCLLNYPVECREWLQTPTRPAEEVPCYEQALALLACDK